MCEVCAVFGIGRHWTDAAARASTHLPAPDISRYRNERRIRIAIVNALIVNTRVVLSDWDGESFVVTDASGRTQHATDLNDVWRAVERLSGQRLDPLADNFPHGS